MGKNENGFNQDVKNMTMGEILGMNSQEKKEVENKVKEQGQKVENEQEQKTQIETKSSDKLYQQLAAKYNIPLEVLDKQMSDKELGSFNQYKKQMEQKEREEREKEVQKMPVSEAQQLAIQKRLGKQKHISQYKQRKEIDPYLRGSFLDKQDEDRPRAMTHLEGFRPFQPDMNIGKKAADMITTSATSQMKYEMALQKGDGFLWHAAKTGKLGVDLYLCIFAAVGMFIIPYYFYKVQQRRMEWWRRERGIDKNVKDFEQAGFDLDDLSIEGTFENMFTKEILEEKKKKIDMHKEIKSIMDNLFSNK